MFNSVSNITIISSLLYVSIISSLISNSYPLALGVNCRKTREFRHSLASATITFRSQHIDGTFNLYDNRFDSGTQIWGRYFHPLNKSLEYNFQALYHSTCKERTNNKLYKVEVTDGFLPKDLRQNDGTCVFETTAPSWYMGNNVPIVVIANKGYERVNANGKVLHYWKPLACAPVVAARKDIDVNVIG